MLGMGFQDSMQLTDTNHAAYLNTLRARLCYTIIQFMLLTKQIIAYLIIAQNLKNPSRQFDSQSVPDQLCFYSCHD